MSNIFDSSKDIETLEDLFLLVIAKASKLTRVSALCLFDSIEKEFDENQGYGIVKVKKIPIEPDQKETTTSIAYFFHKIEFKKNKFYGIIYTDYDFRDTLSLDKVSRTRNKNMHDLSFAILLDL